jgi:hypothetical protein
MNRTAALATLPSTYNDFLYAPVSEDRDGMPVTVLSVLARQNLDPWEEAAGLSRLPEDAAMKRLSSMIAMLPGQSVTSFDPTVVSGRLMTLLPPPRVTLVSSSENASLAITSVIRSPMATRFLFVVIYVAMVYLCFANSWL